MRIVLENIDNQIYGDIILNPKELDAMRIGEMIDGTAFFEKKKCYIGVRLQGAWDDKEEKQSEKEDNEGFS
jgi:hypothetical protein